MNDTLISVKESLTFGWETFKKDTWFYVGVTAALTIFSMIVSTLTSGGEGFASFVGFVISYLASTVVTIAYMRLALSAAQGTPVGWDGLWAPEHYVNMLGTTILQSVIVVIGLVLLIVPGIIAAILLSLSQLAVVDKKLHPIDALKESYRLTRPHVWSLFVFMLALLLLNLAGLLALVIGLLVTMPVSLIATAHVYKKLVQGEAPAVMTPPATPAQ